MANFLLICDPDATRGQGVALRARGSVAFLPHLRSEIALSPGYALVWAAVASAPVELHRATRPDQADCLLLGEPHDGDGRRVSATDLAEGRSGGLNGYFAALWLHPQLGARVEADGLGLFPIYYWRRDSVLLVASSPALFRFHPDFRSDLDLHGVAALLLTSGIVGGRTLWQGVRRLGADHVLSCLPGAEPRELAPAAEAAEPALDDSREAAQRAASLHRAFLHAALVSADRPGMLLSGGLDSRLLAGFADGLGYRPTCVTFGRAGDLDADCATLVARELGWPQVLCDVPPGDYVTHADLSVQVEQLSGGLYVIPMGWNIAARPPAVAMDRVICGLTLDAVLGGPQQVATAGPGLSFEQLRIGRLGYRRDRLARLVARPDLLAACDDVRAELVAEYRAAGATDHLREWRMNLAHRHRFAVGACAWRYSFFAWPVLPALDRGLLRLAARLPPAVAGHRRLQHEMLITLFPRLARLGLDRNYFDAAPLVGAPSSLPYDLRRRLIKGLRRWRAWRGRDPRFYVRAMEFNGPGWRAVRTLAEQARAAVRGLFLPGPLAEALPAARVTVRRLRDPIIDSTPLKNTLGLMLWMHQHG